jgi:hypothetical protein
MGQPQSSNKYDQIDGKLRELPIWVNWRKEKRANRSGAVNETKVPYNARSGKRARSNDPSTWSSYEEAVSALERGYDGLGLCLEPPYVGVDGDGCRGDDGVIEPWMAEIIGELDSYTEVSPSGHGVRVIVTGELPDGRRQKDFGDRPHHGIGLYDFTRGRFLTMTGDVLNGAAIAERTPELARIHARLFPPAVKAKTAPHTAVSDVSESGPTDDELITRARHAKDAGKFARLWDGQWEGSYASQSEADLALCRKLSFWTGKDAGRIDALFRQSGLMREKWEQRQDYRELTIARAIEQTRDVWKPKPAPALLIDPYAAPPSIDLLNAVPLFQGRIRFTWLRRRGSMIQSGFAGGREAQWATATDLRVFARSQDILFQATGFLIPSPAQDRGIRLIWEPVAQLIRRIADQDATDIDPPLKDEFEQIIRATWVRADRPEAFGREAFFKVLRECQDFRRDHAAEKPPRCCVWIGGAGEAAEHYCWIYQDALLTWLSTPVAKSKHYAWDDARTGLLLLGFEPRELHRSWDRCRVHVRVWRGPLDLLIDDDSVPESEL